MYVIKTLYSSQHTNEPHTSSGAGQQRVSSHAFFFFVFIRNSLNYLKPRLSKVLEMFPQDLSADSKAISPSKFFLHHSCFKHFPVLLKITFFLENLRAATAENIQQYPGLSHTPNTCQAHFISKFQISAVSKVKLPSDICLIKTS